MNEALKKARWVIVCRAARDTKIGNCATCGYYQGERSASPSACKRCGAMSPFGQAGDGWKPDEDFLDTAVNEIVETLPRAKQEGKKIDWEIVAHEIITEYERKQK